MKDCVCCYEDGEKAAPDYIDCSSTIRCINPPLCEYCGSRISNVCEISHLRPLTNKTSYILSYLENRSLNGFYWNRNCPAMVFHKSHAWVGGVLENKTMKILLWLLVNPHHTGAMVPHPLSIAKILKQFPLRRRLWSGPNISCKRLVNRVVVPT
jgi:hypothetical protein